MLLGVSSIISGSCFSFYLFIFCFLFFTFLLLLYKFSFKFNRGCFFSPIEFWAVPFLVVTRIQVCFLYGKIVLIIIIIMPV